jgi:type I restriction enzyme R subunit
MSKLNFDETKQSQLPAVELLINLGYRFITAAELEQERGGDTSRFILRHTAQRMLSKINSYEHRGTEYHFSEKDIAEVIDELENIPFEGLQDTSKKIYSMIMPRLGGKTVKVFHDGSYESKSIRYIDFDTPENNDFAVAVEVVATGKGTIRLDICIYVNGIPFAVIENKKSSTELENGIAQLRGYQDPNHYPKLFAYIQLLIASNKEDCKYGVTGTPSKFYARWKERELIEEEWKYRDAFKVAYENQVKEVISTPIDPTVYAKILTDLNGYTFGHTQVLDRLVTQQDLALYGILRKERLLDLVKNFILFDAGKKIIMRYQQYFAIKKMLLRISQLEEQTTGQKRRGGILWHTQGSGKSLTMVMFVKALIEDTEIQNPRVLVVTDRKDLDRQIKGTFENAGLKKEIKQATSGEDLLYLIQHKDLRVLTTLIHKFQSASKKQTNFVDSDKNIFVLIDEAHRSQGGDANLEMNRVIPNACYIAFTGTPLLKKDKSKLKFGTFIDKYTIDDALADEIILPLIYEGRYVDLRQDSAEIDKQTTRLLETANEEQRKKLQDQVKHKMLTDNPQRIEEIGYDILNHFRGNFAGTGLKGQIVAPSKYAAILFQRYFEAKTNISTALVISDENGYIPEDDEHKKEVDHYLQEIKANYQSLFSYEKEVIDSFKHNEDGVELLIVVDKLLTGFDAPRNTVLYLAKQLQDHNLLQAIARVNRLYDSDVLPKTAGFIIDYSENALNLKTAMKLFGNYDEDDVKGALINVNEKVDDLEQSYGQLHDLFNGVAEDDEAYLRFLGDEPTRKQFYELLNSFLRTFAECMALKEFVHNFDHIDIYRKELKQFVRLRQTANLRYAENSDFSMYKRALIKILDKNIKAEEAELLTKQISLSDKEAFDEAVEQLHSDASKAEAIAAQMSRTITEKLEMDPVFYTRFSQKISKLLDDMRERKLSDIQALKKARAIKDAVLNKKDAELPSAIVDVHGADILYRNLSEDVMKYALNQEQFEQLVLDMHKIIHDRAIVDWHRSSEQKRIILNALDDYLYDVLKLEQGIDFSAEDRQKLIERALQLAQNNYQLFTA